MGKKKSVIEEIMGENKSSQGTQKAENNITSIFDGLKKIWNDLTGEQKSAFISEALKEKELYDKFRELGFVTTPSEVGDRAKERLGIMSLVEKINLVDLITEITTIGSLDLVKSIASIDLIKSISSIDLVKSITALGTVDLIKSITSIDLVKTITSIGTLDLLKSITSIDLVKAITEITNIKNLESLDLIDTITTLGTVNLIKAITSVDLIKDITSLDTLDLVKSITSIDLVKSITTLGTLNLVNTISQITNIANLQSLDLIDSITSIDLLKSITSIGSLDLVKSITSIDLVKTITSIGTLDLLKSITSIDLVKSITSIASLDLVKSITSIDLLKEITTIGTVNVAKVITSGLDNIVIDLLKVGAYTERRSTLSNNGASPSWDYSSDTNFYMGKFFPRGARGWIDTIEVYCKDNGAAGGTITVYVAPYIGAGKLASATITVPAGGGEAWRSASFARMWNYDSLFIFIVGSTTNMRYAYDSGIIDQFYSADAGVTWVAYNYRSWIRVLLKAETVGDIPVSGTVNTIEIPSLGTEDSCAYTNVPNDTETTLLTIDGGGTLVRARIENLSVITPSGDIFICLTLYADGVQSFFVTNRELTQSVTATSGKSPIGIFFADTSWTIMEVYVPVKFRRSLKLTVKQTSGINKSFFGWLETNKIK